MSKHMIVTSALPYANAPLHLGHILEHVQADIWVRFNKLCGQSCYFICADDTHGTPIMLKAQELGISPEQLISEIHQSHLHDFTAFNISYDHYYTTNSPENKQLVYEIYSKLLKNDKIARRTISQFYDEIREMFLPDRFIKGTCPKCKTPEQYGDNCEKCGAIYEPTDLIEPYSILSKTTPVLRESEHYFFKLSECSEFLTSWLNDANRLHADAKNKLTEWLGAGLRDWDISRDKPYLGFEIPDAPGKYFYVWMDAPIGYLSSFMHYCQQHDLDFQAIWNSPNTEIYHFIGKDILYFHGLFWPAVLNSSDYQTPTSIFTHGFLTIDGQKMSKSRGTFINAKTYLDLELNPEFLRYYFATKSNAKIEDIDFSLADFTARINSELVGKFINIAARAAGFIERKFANRLTSSSMANHPLLLQIIAAQTEISQLYRAREFAKVIKIIMSLVDEVNQFVDNEKPWLLAKDNSKDDELHIVCSTLINAFRLLTIYLKPILPKLSSDIEQFLAISPLSWTDLGTLLNDHQINSYTHLINRVDPKVLNGLIGKTASV